MKPVFQSPDGALFPTPDECLAHERLNPEWSLVGRTIEEVRAAIARNDPHFADAIEVLGAAIARDRRADGELKRERKPPAPPTLAIAGPANGDGAETELAA